MEFTKYKQFGAYHWQQYEQNTKYTRHADRVKARIKEKKVLDIGCGDGKITDMLGAVGIDNDETGVDLAIGKGVNARVGDAYQTGFKDEEFEAVFMGDVLEHMEFPKKALMEARRILSKYLYLACPTKGDNHDKFHYQEWTGEELKELVEAEGFTLVEDVLEVKADKRIYAKFEKNYYDLAVLIPARNEMFLRQTIKNLIDNIRGRTEIIAVLDGVWADPVIEDNERVTLVHFSKSVGQRAATNVACKLTKAKWVMKVDAHCAFDEGFDVKMMEAMEGNDDWTMVPAMYNLHAFDWVCPKCEYRIYQGRTPEGCDKCGEKMEREIVWKPRQKSPTTPNGGPKSYFYRFDTDLHFQYWNEFKHRPEAKGDIADTMSIQGSCFMLTRQKYWQLDISSEQFNSWGQQGVEVACKTWPSGGRVVVNKNTWYAHLFRTQGGDFGFPFDNPESKIQKNRDLSRQLFQYNGWDKAIHPFSWLIDKFDPPGWKTPEISKGIIYYTDNKLEMKIARKCRDQLLKMNLPIASASLKPMPWFGDNVYLPLQRGYLTMFKQILAALEKSKAEIVFFCEHDVLYHPSHFSFIPHRKDRFYYNLNVWKVDAVSGRAVHYDCKQTSGICVYRDLAIQHYKKRIEMVEKNGFNRRMGFEPATHKRPERVDDLKSEVWYSEYPNIDIRHNSNLTETRWDKKLFRNQSSCQNWIEAEYIEGWGFAKDVLK